jgi:hypothetical protein
MSGMHLLPVYYNTLASGKRRRKANRKPGWEQAQRDHEAYLRKMGVHPDQRKSSTSRKSASLRDSNYWAFSEKTSNAKIPSLDNGMKGSTAKQEPKVYTGTEIIGIAQMHKSNAVPISSKKDAVEVARMRRG